MIAGIFHSNSLWIMRYLNFWNGEFVDFQILTDPMSMGTSDLRQKSVSYFKKPNDAVEVFASIGSKHYLGASGGEFRLELFDTKIWQQWKHFFFKVCFCIMASKIYSIPRKFASQSLQGKFPQGRVLTNSFIIPMFHYRCQLFIYIKRNKFLTWLKHTF